MSSKVSVNSIYQEIEDEKIKRKFRSNTGGEEVKHKFVDQFLIVGSNYSEEAAYFEKYSYGVKVASIKPRIVFQTPEERIEGLNYNLLTKYCFPNKIQRFRTHYSSKKKCEERISTCNKSHLNYKSAFTYIFTGNKQDVYAVCMSKTRYNVVKRTSDIDTDKIVFVLLTTNPLFELHYRLLQSSLSIEELNDYLIDPVDLNDDEQFKKQHDTIQLMYLKIKQYCELQLPTELIPLRFNFICDLNTFIFKYIQQPNTFYYKDSFEMNVFLHLELKNIMLLISSFMLEYKVILVSKRRFLISSVILFLLSVIHPFKYESSIVCILSQELYTILESPTPILVGMTSNPPFVPDYSLVYDLDKDVITCKNSLCFPGSMTWIIKETKDLIQQCKRTEEWTQIDLMEKESSITESIEEMFRKGMMDITNPFRSFCIKSIQHEEQEENITLFLAQDYVNCWKDDDKKFMSMFVKTQMFENYKMEQLLDLDSS